jgi:hypothetical protein
MTPIGVSNSLYSETYSLYGLIHSLDSQPRHPYQSLLLHCNSQALSTQQQQPHICPQWSLHSERWQPCQITCLGRVSWLVITVIGIINIDHRNSKLIRIEPVYTLQIVYIFGKILFDLYLFILKSKIFSALALK